MANNINWGEIYCTMKTNEAWGADFAFTTSSILDAAAPECWGELVTADLTQLLGSAFTSDTTLYKADITQT